MDYEWDPEKARDNLKKHGVDFADAVISLEDENALTIEDKDHDEVRFKTLGMDPYLNVLYVVHTEVSSNRIRIISARKADKKEKKYYFRGLRYE
ncbi:BrnT family toxin [Thiolapillus sp.]